MLREAVLTLRIEQSLSLRSKSQSRKTFKIYICIGKKPPAAPKQFPLQSTMSTMLNDVTSAVIVLPGDIVYAVAFIETCKIQLCLMRWASSIAKGSVPCWFSAGSDLGWFSWIVFRGTSLLTSPSGCGAGRVVRAVLQREWKCTGKYISDRSSW